MEGVDVSCLISSLFIFRIQVRAIYTERTDADADNDNDRHTMGESHRTRHGSLLSPRAVTDRLPRSPSLSSARSPSPSPSASTSTSPLPSRHRLPTSPMGLEGIVMCKVASNDQGWEISFDDVGAEEEEDEDDDLRHEDPCPGGFTEK